MNCSHDRLRFVWRIFEGKDQKTRRYGFQCLDCGRAGRKGANGEMSTSYTWVSAKNVHEYFEMDYLEAVSMHDALTDRLKAAERDYWDDLYEQRRHKRGPWWDWYNLYLQCDEWQALRERVFERDGGICRHTGCGRPAEQVHHLTYDRVGYELLSDLVSVCIPCHERTHR
jgi:5-methylcytosine-specific restriction endonuclease McrA